MEAPEPGTTTPHECEDLGCIHVAAYVDDDLELTFDPQTLEIVRGPNPSWTDAFQSYSAATDTDALPSVFLVVRAFRNGDGYGREIFDATRDREEAERLIARHSSLMPNNQWVAVEYVPTF
jgi:hypothetical protein